MNEKRIYRLSGLEVRAAVDGQSAQIVGYAAVFNSLSVELWGFREIIERGAFRETLAKKPDVRATIDHEGGLMTLGRTKAGTLELSEDGRGLRVRITPPDTQAGRDVTTLLQRGDIDQMSFMFQVEEETWEQEANDLPVRTLKKINIDDGDVSIVTYPAYKDTEVSVEARNKAKELARRDAGQIETANNPGPDEADDKNLAEGAGPQVRHARRRLEIIKRK
jgi:HK97 family phage prohead protease